ncbi:hypothetical protein P0E52_03090 [Enterococcus faecalis]|uniref:hypothetical protein n=1 Tax=Enterococcus faecalis TaxID=1351 RepID=UPI0025B015AD|nr:hypothetical protein [Enterococcus faecalis]MDN3112998.1 hypothetical protein [Enterococcus faecalis]
MGIIDVANKKLLYLENLISQIKEAEEYLVSIKNPALNNKKEVMLDIEIGISTHFMGSGFFREEGHNRWHKVRLEEDLGIVGIQADIKELVEKAVNDKITEMKDELRKSISKLEVDCHE